MDGFHPQYFGQGIAGHGRMVKTESDETESSEDGDPVPEL